MSDSRLVLSLRLESVAYGDRIALRDVALDIARGEIVGIAGHVGAGKSTLALAAAGLLGRSLPATIRGTIVHPGGVNELYLGQVKGPRIDLATDAVVRTSSAKEYAAATRLYGLVDDHLLWAWDIAALGQELRTHASGRLARVE